MRRALEIAATCSVALHLTAFALSEYLFDGSASPSIANRVLVLNLRVPQADVNVEHETSLDNGAIGPESGPSPTAGGTGIDAPLALLGESEEGAPSSENPAPAREPDLTPAETVRAAAPQEDAADAGADTADARNAENPSDEARDSDPVGQVAAEWPGHEPGSAQRVASVRVEASATVPESETLSPKQKQMLNRKIRKWTRDADRLMKSDGMQWEHQGQEYVATFRSVGTPDDQTIEQVVVEISTESGGRKLTTEMHMRRLAFSNYAQFVNRWDPTVGFHDDELDGRFHSNTEISLADDRRTAPRFHGKVTTAAHRVNYGDGPGYVRRGAIFLGGLETGIGAIQFPERFVPFPANTGAREDRVQYFEEDTHITFYADGTYGWRAVGSATEERRGEISKDSSYLVATAKAELHVEGTLDGKVLLYSPERIVVEGDLVYSQDPATAADADDYLGLVSDKYVDIASPDVTGTGDLRIDAAIYAKRAFTVRNYGAKHSGRLDLYGSLTAGSLSATEPRYTTRIRFDPRLEKLRPPAFPLTDRYEMESWDGVWRVGSAPETR
jgi:hypothetical protein